MVEKKRICGTCGLPAGIGKGNVWHANGVITAAYPPHIRGTLYDTDELGNLFPAISGRIGFDISRLVLEGKRKDGKRYAASLAHNLRAAGRDADPMTVYGLIARFCAYWGLGLASPAEYRAGEKLVIETGRTYNRPMAMGDWAGVFEAMEERRGEPHWREERGRDLIEIRAVEGEPEIEERIEQEVELGIPFTHEGELEYRRCSECGVPLEVSRQFEWDADRALIVERLSGRRFVLHNTNGIVAVVRVLREELGEEIGEVITEVSRDYAREYYAGIRGDTSMEAELAKFPLRSWGRPVLLARGDEGFRLRVVNPYSPPIVAGRIWGLVEVFEDSACTAESMEEGEGCLEISLARKR
ncbi:MAG: hypothetical protein QME88_03630 [Actinomycetota bacterium]|nr:hypothetical protein [Actinomycetota bacterium]